MRWAILVDVLLRNRPDATLDPPGVSTFGDDGVDVAVFPVDRLVVALVRRDRRLPLLSGGGQGCLPGCAVRCRWFPVLRAGGVLSRQSG